MKKIAFTLIEVLLAMTVIGIIAGATANSLKKISADKVKLRFQNCYNHMQQTFDNIFSDENIIPIVYTNSYDSRTGKRIRSYAPLVSTASTYTMDSVGVTTASSYAIHHAFKNLTGGVLKVQITASPIAMAFDTKNGAYWVVSKNSSVTAGNCSTNPDTIKSDISKAPYFVIFDVDGPYEGTNCPYSGTYLNSSSSTCKKPDTFKFGINIDYTLFPDTSSVYDSKNLKTFMKDNNYIETKF